MQKWKGVQGIKLCIIFMVRISWTDDDTRDSINKKVLKMEMNHDEAL